MLPAGEHHIDGVTALAFWRTREDIGYGSDLQRIQRDQFMSAQLAKGVMASGQLRDPVRLLSVLSAIAPSLTIDSRLSLADMPHIGESLRGLSGKDVQFVTTPNQPFPADPAATVEFAQPQAGAMFTAIAHDVAIPKTAESPARVLGTGKEVRGVKRAKEVKKVKGAQAPGPAATSVGSLAAANGGIYAAASRGRDAAAFAGPLSP